MAQWNPYYGIPNQTSESVYEEQNLSQNYYGIQPVPYAPVPLQSYNAGYYVANNLYSNYGGNLSGTVYNVQDLEAQQFACYNQNANRGNNVAPSTETSGKQDRKDTRNAGHAAKYTPRFDSNNQNTSSSKSGDNSATPSTEISNKPVRRNVRESWDSAKPLRNNDPSNSTLHATAAEFKPSTSASTNSRISSQTYYRNNTKNKGDMRNTGAVRKTNSLTDFKRKTPENPVSEEENKPQSENQRPYNRSNSGQNYNNKSQNRDRNRGIVENNQRYKDQNMQRYENRNNNRNYRRQDYDRGESDFAPRSNNFRQNYDPHSDSAPKKNNFRQNYDPHSDSAPKSNNSRQNYDPQSDSAPKSNNSRQNYNRNYRDYPERNNSERNTYSRDNFNKSSKNSYRNNRYENTGYENWRTGPATNHKTEKTDNQKSDRKSFRYDRKIEKLSEDDISQRDRLTEQVNKGTLECLVCCDRVRQQDKIWYCQKCYHIFHFRCITKWGNSSKDENGWRCPACQHVCSEIPSSCFCYCGKMSDPPFNPTDTAHSCGDICGRMGIKLGCTHRCNLLCHPGPCPKCEILISKRCNCGATTQMVQCSAETVLVCTAICGKVMNCGEHKCEKICHGGDCDGCLKTIHQDCHCGKFNRTIPCSKDQTDIKVYSCEQTCEKPLSCGNHKCEEICHPGDCPLCERSPEQVKTCPCGKSKLEVVRTSCLDPIPCCGKICGKRYPKCGTAAVPHLCKSECHEGKCPNCPLNTYVRCRCGHMNCELTCTDLISRSEVKCGKKCTKKRSCGRHKCNQLCCIDLDHVCPLPCNHTLSCGLHKCEQTCHNGRCQPCWRISFDELFCECGAAVIMPPVPCGTKRPKCSKICTREHGCQHEPLHTCHSLPDCPPCTVLTTKYCFGGHEKRSTIPCHLKDFSCGLPCGKELVCGRHKCQLPCHNGPCLKEGQTCTQPCTVIRENCGHPCGLPCHDPPCQDSPCKESVKVTCQCGLRSSTRACVDMAGEYQRIATSMLASKMADMQLGHSIDIADIVGTNNRNKTLKTLECNDECRLVERNRRLAIGLQIRNPDLSSKLTPRYSDFMRQWAKKDSAFCQMVHDKLTELVQLAKQSKQKSRSFSFPSMNREKRQFVHEYCEHFGCETAAYDQEPNRNVVATAARDKAWLPSCSLLELIQRESGQRKVPGPILNRPLGVSKASDIVSLKIPSKSTATSANSTSFSSAVQQQPAKSPEDIDYFNFPSGSK